MSELDPRGEAFGLAEFCRWLDSLSDDHSARELLRVILGEPRGADLDLALGRARRVVEAMTCRERVDPRSIDLDRRAEIAAEARVDLSDVSELFLRFDAAAALVKNNEQIRRMVLSRRRRVPPPMIEAIHSLHQRRERDLALWDFLQDEDLLAIC